MADKNSATTAAAAAATLNSLLAFGFDETSARAAVEAIGDKSDVSLATSWLLDHGEPDRGGAIQFVHCPHLDAPGVARLAPSEALAMGAPCLVCNSTKENWICLFCARQFCSRYVGKHCVSHWEETKAASPSEGHHLAISEGDLSVWCHECEAYVNNAEVQPHVVRLQTLKFGSGSAGDATAATFGSAANASGETDKARGKQKMPALAEGEEPQPQPQKVRPITQPLQ